MPSATVLLWVAVGGALGAVGRYAADRAAQRWAPSVVEVGVLVANLVACALLGWVAGGTVLVSSAPGSAPLPLVSGPVLGWDWWLLGSGLAGALSTWSTLTLQVVRRWVAGQRSVAVALGLATWVLGAGAARLAAEASVALTA